MHRSITLKPIREERTVSVSHTRSSGRRHHRRRCQDLHEDGREEGIPSMPTRRRKPGPHHVHHTLRPVQIPSSPVRHLVHLRALQQTHGRGIRRATRIPTSCRRRRYLRQRPHPAHTARPVVPPALRGKENHSECRQVALCPISRHIAGLCLSPEGYHVDPSIIADFPTPANRTDLRSFIGMVNQLSATVATLLSPLRPLLRTRNEFVWSENFEHAFKAAKASLTSAPTLAYFDPTKPTRLCTDASCQGLGFILQQQHADAWLIVQAGSRFLSDAESRYAVVELELLAVSWAINKCHMFLAGMHFTVVTDHHPLIPILNTHRLDEIENPRLQRLKTKIMGYTFKAEWLKGALNHASDALSRYPSSDPTPDEQLAEQDLDNHQAATAVEIRAIAGGDQDSPRLQGLREAAESDHEYQQLKHYIYNGFPDHRQNLPEQCRRYWHVRAQLSVEDDFIVYGCRLLVPATLRREVLNQLHDSHQGMVRTKA